MSEPETTPDPARAKVIAERIRIVHQLRERSESANAAGAIALRGFADELEAGHFDERADTLYGAYLDSWAATKGEWRSPNEAQSVYEHAAVALGVRDAKAAEGDNKLWMLSKYEFLAELDKLMKRPAAS